MLEGGANRQADVPHRVGQAISASLVFVHTQDDRPVKVNKSWRKRNISQAKDIVAWMPQQSALQVVDTSSSIHTRLRRRLERGLIKLSPLFERVKDSVAEASDEHEAFWMLAQLAGRSLSTYTPMAGNEHQQRHTVVATSPYNHPTAPVSVWKSVNRKVLMPKLRCGPG